MENERKEESETDVYGIKQRGIEAENGGKMMAKGRN